MTVDLVARAEDLAELVEANADRAERERRVPLEVIHALRDAQLLRMCVPAVYGGPEADPVTLVRAIEAVAVADGATGWCVMIASTTSSMSLFMDPEWARRIYADPASITGGVYAPTGRAERVEGGFRISGRWAWGSGSQHCTWLSGGTLDDDGVLRLMFVPAAEASIHDTWDAHGLAGTGSHDFSIDGALVPEGRWVQPIGGEHRLDLPLAAFPNFSLLAAGVAAVSLGIARHAIDELVDLAQGKRPLYSSRTLAQSGYAQAEVALAEADVRSARAFLLDELGQAWATAVAGGEVDEATRGRIRLACVHAAHRSAAAIDRVYTVAGGSSVHRTSPLQRCLRDAHVATQHLMVSPRMREALGKQLFGLPVDATTF